MKHSNHVERALHNRGVTTMPRSLSASLLIIMLILLSACTLPFDEPGATAPPAIIVTPTPRLDATEAVAQVPPTTVPTESPMGATPEVPSVSEPRLLEQVLARGRLVCGVNEDLPGFASPDPNQTGNYRGFDADFCRVIAAAVFGDATAVEFVPLNVSARFRAVINGDVDVLIRNTTWTALRDTGLQDDQLGLIRLDFGPIIFHDGQRFMIREGLTTTSGQPVVDVAGLFGKSICVIDNTTSTLNLRDQMAARGLPYIPIIKATTDEAFAAYDNEECDAITSDTSQLVGRRVTLSNPSEHTILAEQISREPLAPVVIEHDSQWRDIVSWAIFATIYAEELDVTSRNLSQELTSSNPDIQRLLGRSGNIGVNLGLTNDFALNIIREVGNYEEIYNRNLGPETPFDLDRGPNKAWNKGGGGVLSSPPFR
ncbi:amino acid ABC transporter substrate-binding protein [Candidatus Chloroploca sp. M-50]|uniref:Amino acid ABC transporter substrate-binding protein n=2 Tax=Candidatus Chloroploca mongolica TaxID=2528176 RepID=A0ABS4DHV9_9CHLR|nr:amino acid ABC transporter substrate-binding protein [Candidatus Chloroploca mongolica]